MQLYELAEIYQEIQGEDDIENVLPTLDELEEDLEIKIENIGKVIQSFEAEKAGYKAEIARMQKQVKRLDENSSALKTYLMTNMELAEISKAGEIVKVSLRNSPPSCALTDIDKVPDDFKTAKASIPVSELPEELRKYVSEETISKKEIVALWRDGVEVDGTEVSQGKHVRIA